LFIYKQDGWFRCVACGAEGNLTKLWNTVKGWDTTPPQQVVERTSWNIPQLPRDLVGQEEICNKAHDQLSQYVDSFGWYLEQRKLIDRVEVCRLGYYSGWYTIPFYNQDFSFSGMVMRAGKVVEQATGRRFAQPRSQRPTMYVPVWASLRNRECLFMVFGIFDALAMSSAGLAVCTPTHGKDTFHPEWLDFWRKKIIIVPDKDEEETAYGYLGGLGWRGKVATVDYPDGMKDPADMISAGMTKQLIAQIGGAT
jgi:hypothetical protein